MRGFLLTHTTRLTIHDTRARLRQFLTLLLALPFSRKFEHEADFIGYRNSLSPQPNCTTFRRISPPHVGPHHSRLMLMAKAGYDPTNAVDLWIRFSAASPSSKPRYESFRSR